MQILQQIREDFEAYLSEHPIEGQPRELYDPVEYILQLGGKRFRPTVLLLSTYLFGGAYAHALPAAGAIEFFHNFTLAHDDIMDEAPVRRGRPSVHKKFGINTGILAGDVLMVQAFNALLGMDTTRPELLKKVLDIFTRQAIGVCEGQQMDLNFETRDDVTIEEYLKMIELKTAVLVGAAMQIGALLGGASDADATALYQFGCHLGIAFQLQDDLLDTYGDPEKFGKKAGGDIVKNKKTILYLKALELATPPQRKALSSMFAHSDLSDKEKIEKVISLYDRVAVKPEAEMLRDQYREKAFEFLSLAEAPAKRKSVMEKFALALMERQV
ncbi:MAG TPA: polyprenyl synthetase family protein [Bacteroidetes bacterium]|nr:polyprenyl synthetase family protein [Bacteroidota bacterium]